MSNHLQAYSFSKDQFKCPRCNLVFEGSGVVTGKPQGLRKGHIMVCSGCGSVLRLGDTEFLEMRTEDIAKLPEVSRKTIEIAQQMIRAQQRHEQKKNNGQ